MAEAFTAGAALLALVLAGCTIAAQREATAKNIYRKYLNIAFDNPDLASLGDRYILLKSSESSEERKRYEQYRWFVAFMLNACDEIIRIKPRDMGWHATIREDLTMHVAYLRSQDFVDDGGWQMYSRKLKNIFDLL